MNGVHMARPQVSYGKRAVLILVATLRQHSLAAAADGHFTGCFLLQGSIVQEDQQALQHTSSTTCNRRRA